MKKENPRASVKSFESSSDYPSHKSGLPQESQIIKGDPFNRKALEDTKEGFPRHSKDSASKIGTQPDETRSIGRELAENIITKENVKKPHRTWHQIDRVFTEKQPQSFNFFSRILDDELFKFMANRINEYKKSKGEAWEASPWNRRWTDASDVELMHLVGLFYFMGIVKKPTERDYWKNEDTEDSELIIRKMMARGRFQQILQCFPGLWEDTISGDNQASTLRNVYNKILENSRKLYHGSKILSLDSLTLPYLEKQNIPEKQTTSENLSYRLEVLLIAESSSGFVLNCELSKIGGNYDADSVVEAAIRMLSPFKDNGYSVYIEAQYTSNKLLKELSKLGIKACGMLPPQSLEVSDSLKTEFKSLQIGDSRQYFINDQLIAVWKTGDAISSIISTIHLPSDVDGFTNSARDVNNVLNDKLAMGRMLQDYGTHSTGKNRFEEKMLQEANSHAWSNKKFSVIVFYYFLEVAMVNSYIMYLTSENGNQKLLDQKHYRMQLIDRLCSYGKDKAALLHCKEKQSEPDMLERLHNFNNTGNCALITVEKSAHCMVCKLSGIEYKIRTSYRCQTCQIPVCVVGCYDYHRMIVEGQKFVFK